MDTRTYADSTLRELGCSELDTLIRAATAAKQRHFALACVRLAVSNAGLDDPIVEEAIGAAAWVLKGMGDTTASQVVEARERAEALMRRLDDRQLTISEEIEADLGGDKALPHPRDDEQRAAFRRFCAASAIACLLHDHALEAAAQCAYELLAGLKIDLATILAIGRDTLR